MTITHARKMRIYPTGEQIQKIDTTLNCCRFVYNKMIERNRKVYSRRNEHLSYYDMQNLLPEMKKYLFWLKDADSQALKYSCRQVNTAYDKFFKKLAKFPHFHSKKGRQSFTATSASTIKVESNKVKLPCIGWIETSDKRDWPDDYHICYATVSREPDGRYYVSVTYKTEIPDVDFTPDMDNILGLDYKSDGLYMDSDGHLADMPKYYRKAQRQLKKLMHQLSKKQGYRKGEKSSNSFKKLLKRINKLYSHTAHQREDFLQKLSTEIANQYDGVCIENLDMRAMANKGFSNGKATNDNGYGMFVTMLNYKLKERGKHLIKVDRWYPSSQICSCCGHRQPMPVTVRTYKCPECGNVMDRDLNAAINIRNEGIRLLTAAT